MKPLTALDRDHLLSELLARLTDDLRAGQEPPLQAMCVRHPELAEELRDLWAAAQVAEQFARPSMPRHSARTVDASSSAEPTDPTLPNFADYDILGEIGRGGMGVVYKARQRSLNRIVAIKMIRDGALASPESIARFRSEAEAVARLQHPGIVTVHEVGQHEGRAYFCMPFVPGPTLASRIAEGPLPALEAAGLVSAIARAVQHAHEHGIIHRDLKPSNVLLDSAGQPKITDFGLAYHPEASARHGDGALTSSGAILGTPSYMPPEQAAGRRGPLTPAADVWSLGAILYECLTGRPPFKASTPVDTILQVLEQEPVPPRLLAPGLDRDLEVICLKCLQKPAEFRYASAAALADDLDAFLNGERLSTGPSGLRHFVGRMLRPTHHASVLQNWGLLWMWHSLAVFLLCLATECMRASGILHHHAAYLGLWSLGLMTWGAVLWQLRRRDGPVLFVERQIAHAWAAGVCASIGMFVIEVLTPLPPLTLSPGIAVAAAMIFIVKAGILSGEFYVAALLLFLTAAIMAVLPWGNVGLFGAVSALCFFVPGLKYYRQRLRDRQERSARGTVR